MIRLTTDRAERPDGDPIQLRWAGVPRSRSFDPVDLRRDQRELLNVLVLNEAGRWRLVTFEDPDFDPRFSTELAPDLRHVLKVAVFSDNADTTTRYLVAHPLPDPAILGWASDGGCNPSASRVSVPATGGNLVDAPRLGHCECPPRPARGKGDRQ